MSIKHFVYYNHTVRKAVPNIPFHKYLSLFLKEDYDLVLRYNIPKIVIKEDREVIYDKFYRGVSVNGIYDVIIMYMDEKI